MDFPETKGEIRAPLRRDDTGGENRPKVRVDQKNGKRAVTRYEVLAESRGGHTQESDRRQQAGRWSEDHRNPS